MLLRYRLAGRRAPQVTHGTLAYTIHSDETGGLFVYAHDGTAPDGVEALAATPSAAKVPPLAGADSPTLSPSRPPTDA